MLSPFLFANLAQEYNHKFNSTALPSNSSNLMMPSPQQQQQQLIANQMSNGFNKLNSTGLASFKKNTITLNARPKQPTTTSTSNFTCQPNIAFLDNINGVSRVVNLKPKKSITIHTNKATSSNIVNTFNLKPNLNGVVSSTPNGPVSGIHRSKISNSKLIRNNVNLPQSTTKFNNNGNSLLNKNQTNNHHQQQLTKNYMHCNNVNFVSQTPNSSFLTLKITGNGLQSKYSLFLLLFALFFFFAAFL